MWAIGQSFRAGGEVADTDSGTEEIAVDDFLRVEIRVGRIVRAEPSPLARKPAYKLWIDFGDASMKTSSAQITAFYSCDELIGRLVLAVTNFPARKVADVSSEVLVLGVPLAEGNDVVLVQPDRQVPLGSRVL